MGDITRSEIGEAEIVFVVAHLLRTLESADERFESMREGFGGRKIDNKRDDYLYILAQL